MHMSLEDLNLLLENKLDEESRLELMDHILECDQCAARFRALHELRQTMNQPKRKSVPLRYVLGVAAVLAMAFSPYFNHGVITESATPTLASMDVPVEAGGDQTAPGMGLLDRVEALNFNNAVNGWGSEKSMIDLVAMQNRG